VTTLAQFRCAIPARAVRAAPATLQDDLRDRLLIALIFAANALTWIFPYAALTLRARGWLTR